jgi:phosphoribosylformylglycinamidine synthase
MCSARRFPHQRIGVVDDGGVLDVQGLFTVPLDELRTAHGSTLASAFEA